MSQQKICPRCGTRAPLAAGRCLRCEHRFRTQFTEPVPTRRRMEVCSILAAACGGLAWAFVIPFRLSEAAFLLGPAAFLLGAVGYHRIRDTPELTGTFQALGGMLFGLAAAGYAVYLGWSG